MSPLLTTVTGGASALEDLPLTRVTYSVAECAQVLGISAGLAYQMVNEGRIGSLRLGHRIVIPRTALQALLESARATGGA